MTHVAPNSRFRTCNAFTLMELLVVVGIIGVLVAVLLPALSKSKLAAMNTVGGADIGSVGKAIFVYAADYRATAPTLVPATANVATILDPGGCVISNERPQGGRSGMILLPLRLRRPASLMGAGPRGWGSF